MIFGARATRGLGRPSPGLMARLGVPVGGAGEKVARSGRSFSLHRRWVPCLALQFEVLRLQPDAEARLNR